jgi:hypothetical protein
MTLGKAAESPFFFLNLSLLSQKLKLWGNLARYSFVVRLNFLGV